MLVEAESGLNFITVFHSFRTARRGFSGYSQRGSDLSAYSADRIEQHIGDCRSAAWHKDLMKLIKRCVARHDSNCSKGPHDSRVAPARAYAAQNQEAQNKVFDEVPAFADDVMDFK
jgi:hypothetical protein